MARRTWLIILGASIVVTAFYNAGDIWATQAVGFTATTLVQGTFDGIDVLNKSIIPNSSER